MIFSNHKNHCIKICTLIVFTILPTVLIWAQSPDMPVSIRLKEAGLKELADKVEKVSGYSFIYGEEVKLKHPITIDLKKTPLRTVLQQAFKGQRILFQFTTRHILLKRDMSEPPKRRFTLNGYVLDSLSRETLIGANIIERENGTGTTTNPFGFFSITLPEGETKLDFSYIGYTNQEVHLNLCKDTLLSIRMQSDNQLEEVVILSDKSEIGIQSSRMGASSIPLDHIKNAPALLSEADVLKTIQLLPGVQSGTTGTSGLHVRGGGPDQNLYLLDGVPLYNVDHVMGFLSVFTPEAVKKVDMYKSSFPARFGGRLSSVVDVRTNDGDMKKYHGSLTIGLLTSRLHFEGPLIKDRTSFIISARRSYIDWIIKPFMPKDENGGYYLYDLNAKVNHRFSDRDRLFLSFYSGKDHINYKYNFNDTYSSDQGKHSMDWGSTLATARWNHLYNSRLFNNTTLTYNHYRFLTKADFITGKGNQGSKDRSDFKNRFKSGIDDIGFSTDFDYHPSPAHRIKFGGQYLYHTFRPEVHTVKINHETDGSTSEEHYSIADNRPLQGHEASLYAEDDFDLSLCLKANAGLRASLFHIQGKTYTSLQPRLSLSYAASDDWTLKASYTQMNQYIHLLSSSALSMPNDLWVPVTRNIKPMKSHQYSVGAYYTGIRNWEFSIEAYYKRMINVLEYKDGSNFQGNSNAWESKVEMGKGTSMGVEFMVEKKIGHTTGWVNYTLAKADRQFKGINNGQVFPYKYDRRHSVNITLNHKLNNRIDLNLSWTYASGNVATLPKEQSMIVYPNNGVIINFNDTYFNQDYLSPIDYTSSRNNFRLPASHQLNIGANFRKKTKHGERIWNVSLFNAYNSMNPNHVYVSHKEDKNLGKVVPVLKKITIFPLLPSFSYTYKF